jgi:malate dehydrogenase (oxaloacetate-decarboxylating)
LRDPRVNRGSAFTAAERAALGLEGLLPAGVLSLDDQADRSYDQYLVYDPVVAEAIELYRHEFQRPDGVYLSIDDIQGVDAALRNYGLGSDDVDLLVATDAEEILGIGDWEPTGRRS